VDERRRGMESGGGYFQLNSVTDRYGPMI